MVAIGGGADSNYFSHALEPARIDLFVAAVVNFVQRMGFDGVDVDFECESFDSANQS